MVWKNRHLVGSQLRRWWFVFVLLSLIHVGEASNPGPAHFEDVFTLGCFNPTGLRNKSHFFTSELSIGDVWMISETHFYGKDVSKFRSGLKAAGAQYRYCVTDVPSMKPCMISTNAWKGVAVVSRFPTRPIPSALPECVQNSGRAILATTLVGDCWITGAVVYGEAESHLHPNHLRNTEFILHHAAAQICHLTKGFRYIAGDWNVDQDSLPAFDILNRAGFRELQDVLLARWGQPIMPTCKNVTRKDFLYLSPELQELLVGGEVLSDVWPDHSVLLGRFSSPHTMPAAWVWPTPMPFPWPSDFGSQIAWNTSLHPTQAYQQLWQDIAPDARRCCPFQVPSAVVGRAQCLEPKQIKPCHSVPLKPGRKGDFQPQFCGQSVKHAQWVRQVRRLQAFCRLLTSGAEVPIPIAETWGAICRAKGFFPDFPTWWGTMEFKVNAAPASCPGCPPEKVVALAMLDSMILATREFEAALMKQSRQYAKFRREQNPNLVFMDVKPPVVPGVDLLLQPIKALIEEVVPEEGKIVLDRPCNFEPDKTIACEGKPLEVIHHDSDALWLYDVTGLAVGKQVSQTRYVGTHADLSQAFLQVWKDRWMRHVDVPPQRWHSILEFARAHIPPGRFDWDPMDVDELSVVIHKKKSKTSAGFDGVTLHDLKHMPRPVLQAFCDIFASAESDGGWPSQLVDGKVVSLAKVASPSSPSDFRPITVFSLLYRCWSSAQARRALTFLDSCLPDTLYGSRPGRHAAQIWTRMLWAIEESFVNQIPMTGAVADLAKAFNFLPRLVVMELAAHVGIPSRVLLAWTGALTQMKRRFQLRDSLSAGLRSVTGVPEGCGLSCVAMVLIDVCFHCWMRVFFPLCTPVSFVDDWQLMTCNPTLLQGAVETMHRFADAMDLHLDERKAYAWSICPNGRKLLRNQGFTVVLGGRNLGAHLQLARKHTNAALQDRVKGMGDFWPRLRLSACRYKTKIRALVASAWPKALHAVAATEVGDAVFHKLRTGAMKGLDADQAGTNAWLQLGLIEPCMVDPRCWAILQTFRCVRECGEHRYVRHMIASLVAGAETPPANSFTTTLLTRLQKLSWHVCDNGDIVDFFGRFCLFRVSFSEVRFRVQWAWQQVVAQQVQHRPGLSSLSGVDPSDTRLWLSTLTYDNQELFKKCLNGCHITQDCKQYCQEGGSDLCPYCQCVDSRFHRFWICEHFASARGQVRSDALALVSQAPESLTCYGWSLRPVTAQRWYAMLGAIPEPMPLLLKPCSGDLHLFTDGSCLNQHGVSCRIASWAVGRAETDGFRGEILDKGPLPGLLQSAYRAEVFAVLRALQLGRQHHLKVFLWTQISSGAP